MADEKNKIKYREIFEDLQKKLRDGDYPQGVPLPSEEALGRKYNVSRITAVRAMDELVKKGLVWRKRGAGTFATKIARKESGRLGLIVPSLSFGEIFPPICQSLTRFAQQDGYTFLLGDISSSRPDAVVCESDYVAAQLRNTLTKFKLSVPTDVMLAGFDDVRCAVSATPPLTTVHQPCADIARVAYQTLRDRMRDSSLPPRRILLSAPLVIRDSTSPI